MNGWTLTRVWQVDNELVVAKTIEEAIELFKTYMGKEFRDEPKNIRAIGTDNYIADYNALIKEKTNTIKVKDVDLMICTITAECCDWLAMNTDLSHEEIEDCRNLMLTIKEERFKVRKGE